MMEHEYTHAIIQRWEQHMSKAAEQNKPVKRWENSEC